MALNFHVDSTDGLDDSVKALYKADDGGGFVLDVSGYKDPDPDGLKSALERQKEAVKSAKDEAKVLKANLKAFEEKYKDIDPEKVKTLLSKVENDAEAKLLADGKLEEVVLNRMEKQKAESERRVNEAIAERDKESSKANKFEQRVLDNHIRAAGVSAGAHEGGINDALLRARATFTLDENGDPVQVDSSGFPVLGKDGKTPFTVKEWLEERKEDCPHWFPAGNSGGGASGNSSTKANVKDLSKLSPRERLLAARQQN